MRIVDPEDGITAVLTACCVSGIPVGNFTWLVDGRVDALVLVEIFVHHSVGFTFGLLQH